MVTMKHEYTTLKVWNETHKSLRVLSALTGETMATTLHRLVSADLERVRPSWVITEGTLQMNHPLGYAIVDELP
jgi:hypothetical protein